MCNAKKNMEIKFDCITCEWHIQFNKSIHSSLLEINGRGYFEIDWKRTSSIHRSVVIKNLNQPSENYTLALKAEN
jgi:hypothetical protein